VVISIIAILASLGVPALMRVMSSGDVPGRTAALRQIGTMINLYATDNNGILPELGADQTGSATGELAEALKPYLDLPEGASEVKLFVSSGVRRGFPGVTDFAGTTIFRMNTEVPTRDGGTINPWEPMLLPAVMGRAEPDSWGITEVEFPEPQRGGPLAWFFNGSVKVNPDNADNAEAN
jgi:type II secretory pathway pseudopilin PulG